MGIAAYNRGSRAISQQIDAEMRAGTPPVNRHYWLREDLEPLYSRITAAEAELDRARACVERLRATLAVERDQAREDKETHTAQIKRLIETRDRFERSWRKCSDLVRACLTPAQVNEYRAVRDRYL